MGARPALTSSAQCAKALQERGAGESRGGMIDSKVKGSSSEGGREGFLEEVTLGLDLKQ